MVKLKRGISTTLIIMILIFITYLGYLGIINYCNSYKEINNHTKERITSIILKSKGEIPNLQTDSTKASWIDEAHNKQKEMMDKVLENLTVVGEARKGKPNKYIIATFYDNMKVYIPYNEKTPYKRILLEIDNHYYVAAAKEEAVNMIVNYMEKQGVLK